MNGTIGRLALKHGDSVVSWLVLGPIVPVSLALAAWWTTFALDLSERTIARATLTTLSIGLLILFTWLRHWAASLWRMSDAALAAVAVFYSVMVYGAFMGLPLFNAGIGIVGGLILGRRAVLSGPAARPPRERANRWATFATLLLLLFCCASATLALREASVASELQHMFHLPFVLTRSMVVGIVIAGGLALLAFQFFAARIAVLLASKFSQRAAGQLARFRQSVP